MQTEEPLEQAIQFLRPLQQLGAQRLETHLLAFEIYLRKNRPLLMLQSIKRAFRLDPQCPRLHAHMCTFHSLGTCMTRTHTSIAHFHRS